MSACWVDVCGEINRYLTCRVTQDYTSLKFAMGLATELTSLKRSPSQKAIPELWKLASPCHPNLNQTFYSSLSNRFDFHALFLVTETQIIELAIGFVFFFTINPFHREWADFARQESPSIPCSPASHSKFPL